MPPRFLLALCLLVTGCITDSSGSAESSVGLGSAPNAIGDLGTLTYRAVDIMLAGAPQVGPATPLVVASVANTEKLESSSPLGNIVADMIRTRLAQTGHTAAELRLRGTVSLGRGDGEFLLSRNRNSLSHAPSAAAAVTGTYAASFEKVYISLKLVSTEDGRILSGADFVAPRADLEGLLDRPQN